MLSESFIFANVFQTSLVLFLSSIISLFYWTFFKKDKKRITEIVSILLLVALIISSATILFYGSTNTGYSTTLLSNILNTFIIAVSFTTLFFIKDFLTEKIKFGEFYFLFFMIIAGSVLLVNTTDLLNMFISIELISLSLYGIISFEKKDLYIESSIKYFLLGSFASVFMILSMAFLYIKTKTLSLNELFYIAKTSNDVLLTYSISFFMISFLFKISIVPFHSWSIDVYCASPTYIVLMIIGFVKLSVFVSLAKIFFIFENELLKEIFYVFIILTLMLSNIAALFTKNIKKILVYSTISHSGYILLSLMGPERWQVYYYLIVYSINAFGAFSLVGILEKNFNNLEYENFKGLYKKNPKLSFSLSIFLFSLAGVPPLVGFFAKFYSFYNALSGGYYYLVIIAAITSAISLYYYLKILIPIFFERSETYELKSSLTSRLIIYFFAILTLILGLFSNPLIEILKKIS
jgi:NADH-quinone oxidoreductase subunit N